MSNLVKQYTAEIKALVSRTTQDIVTIGLRLQEVKALLGHGQWERWLREEFHWSATSAKRMMQVAVRFKTTKLVDLPIDQSALYLLAASSTPDVVVQEALEAASQGEVISHRRAKGLLNKHRGVKTLADYRAQQSQGVASPNGLARPIILDAPPNMNGHSSTFNRTNESVDWAWWTWNPVTGCLHDCPYCYARDYANRFYLEKFEPTFHPERLKAPHHTKVPVEAETDVRARSVFVCSVADLFGKWVPDAWIEAVLTEVRVAPQWNFLFLTKFPQRLASITWPENAWVGTTVDRQHRVPIAEKAFRAVRAPVKWLSCEPLLEDLTFSSLEMFPWVVLGGQSESSQSPAFQPPWAWVKHLLIQAWQTDCLVYMKPNLTVRSQEYPGAQPVLVGPTDDVHSVVDRSV
jgi:protein gp37